MKVITWRDELEYLAIQSVLHLGLSSPKFCAATHRPEVISQFNRYYKLNDNLNLMKIIKQFVIDVSTKIREHRKRYEIYSPFIDASTNNIGCAFGKYEVAITTNSTEHCQFVVVTCLLNQRKNKSIEELHVSGNRCSKCDCNEMCGEGDFKGLCEYRVYRGEKMVCVETYLNNEQYCKMNNKIVGLLPHIIIIYVVIAFIFVSHIVFIFYYKYINKNMY